LNNLDLSVISLNLITGSISEAGALSLSGVSMVSER